MMSSYNTISVITDRRKIFGTIDIDPMDLGRYSKWNFELEVFDLHETESTWAMKIGQKTLKEGSTHNDYYGFGTSRKDILECAMNEYKNVSGTGIDINVTTTLKRTLCFRSDKEPFYNRSIEYHIVPSRWTIMADELYPGISQQDLPDHYKSIEKKEFEIWKNGLETEDGKSLETLMQDLKKRDFGDIWRKKKS